VLLREAPSCGAIATSADAPPASTTSARATLPRVAHAKRAEEARCGEATGDGQG
jgi:hypothetical protein